MNRKKITSKIATKKIRRFRVIFGSRAPKRIKSCLKSKASRLWLGRDEDSHGRSCFPAASTESGWKSMECPQNLDPKHILWKKNHTDCNGDIYDEDGLLDFYILCLSCRMILCKFVRKKICTLALLGRQKEDRNSLKSKVNLEKPFSILSPFLAP